MATENIITETDEIRIRKAIEQAREMQRRSASNGPAGIYPLTGKSAARENPAEAPTGKRSQTPTEEPRPEPAGAKNEAAGTPQNRSRGLFGFPFAQPREDENRRPEQPRPEGSPMRREPGRQAEGRRPAGGGFRHLPSPQEIFMKTSAERPPPYCGDSCPVKKILEPGESGGLKGMDSDMLMLFALMLLLSSEGADQMMLFALLYILL